MNTPNLASPPPTESPDAQGPVRWVPAAVGLVGLVALSLCLIGVVRVMIRSDAEDAVTRDWDPAARQLYRRVLEAPPGEGGSRAGTLLPIRVDEGAKEGRVDFRVFLALPAEWLPEPGASPSQVVTLHYRNAELRTYGMTAKGGNRVRYRQACTLKLYDLAREELIAERELISPDPLPEDYGDAAELSVPPTLVVAELRDLAR